jgi:hypothetical protein
MIWSSHIVWATHINGKGATIRVWLKVAADIFLFGIMSREIMVAEISLQWISGNSFSGILLTTQPLSGSKINNDKNFPSSLFYAFISC